MSAPVPNSGGKGMEELPEAGVSVTVRVGSQ